ncbi:hypothetical protein [Zavarzinia sp. CC-PAN008]|uniref:hypothetical protein n=1 Tax=Zavarzinia sp. CC-PAN008 TaxID=3243332 RepID=UPI003F743AFE
MGQAWARRIDLLVLVLACAFAAAVAVDTLGRAVTAVAYPFELDYAEGAVWTQYQGFRGGTAYVPLSGLPYVVFNYGPVYYLLTWAVDLIVGDGLMAGRLVSVLSTLGAVCAIAVLVLQASAGQGGRGLRVLAAVLAALAFLSLYPVAHRFVHMRVDMTAVMFGSIGLALLRPAWGRPGLLVLPCLCFLAAAFTKQIAIAASLAGFTALLLVFPRRALVALALTVVAGLAVLGLLQVLTDGGFLVHGLGYNLNRMRPSQLGWLFMPPLVAPAFALLVALSLRDLLRAGGLVARARAEPAAFMRLVLALYFAAGLLCGLFVLKVGAEWNYFFDWLAAGAALVGLAIVGLAERRARVHGGRADAVAALGLAVVLLWQASIALRFHRPWADPAGTATDHALLALVQATPGPILSDDMVLLLRAGRTVPFEPAMIRELTHAGIVPAEDVLALPRRRAFSLVLVRSSSPDLFSPEFRAELAAHYRKAERIGTTQVWRPDPS